VTHLLSRELRGSSRRSLATSTSWGSCARRTGSPTGYGVARTRICSVSSTRRSVPPAGGEAGDGAHGRAELGRVGGRRTGDRAGWAGSEGRTLGGGRRRARSAATPYSSHDQARAHPIVRVILNRSPKSRAESGWPRLHRRDLTVDWADFQRHGVPPPTRMVVATGARRPILWRDALVARPVPPRRHELLVVDIAMPRNVAPDSRVRSTDVHLVDLDQLAPRGRVGGPVPQGRRTRGGGDRGSVHARVHVVGGPERRPRGSAPPAREARRDLPARDRVRRRAHRCRDGRDPDRQQAHGPAHDRAARTRRVDPTWPPCEALSTCSSPGERYELGNRAG
jgi:hypothetical protein